jgi:glycosyltransferase involved in cell wall biosynthesis
LGGHPGAPQDANAAQRCSPAMIQAHSHPHSNLLGGTRDFDSPEPRLAMFGPPAVTRRMFEMWRTDRRLQARFNLRNPLHRRDYLLWLSEEGPAIGLGDPSIAAAVTIMQQGTSLLSPPPRWSPQAAQAIVPPRQNLDAWLAEPIRWEFGAQPGGIPMPRVLALLWELRRDVRLHFAQQTPADLLNYLAWCLTQGVLDRCVPIDLTEPGLAAFLDSPDPDLDGRPQADQPPVTRLMRIMAPLYDGPYPDIARQFPHNRQARYCTALWVCCTLRRRYGWPQSFVRRPTRWLSRVAPEAADAFVPLNNLVVGVWELHPDLQARFDLRHHEGRAALLAWFLSERGSEFEVEDLRSSMKSAVPDETRGPTLERPPIFGPKQPVKRDLCLVGYVSLISGRAEDLRMSGVALRRQGRSWAMLDRLSGQITTESERAAVALAEPPRLSLVHLNADTAFFDYLFMRERGIERSYTIGCWAWELAKFPAEWASSFAFVDEVWAATRFAYEALASAARKPVLLMPPAVALPAAEPGLNRADFGLPDDKFVFYFSFDFRSYAVRKNPLAAVEAFRRAFPQRRAPVFLLLKTIGSDWKRDDRDNLLAAIRSDPRILLIDREFTRSRATALLALTDCFLSLHRCEGFGRGPAEAMLLGKPVITTAYSGTADFTTPETALLIDYELVPVGEVEYPGASGQVWAEPDIEQAASAMRRLAGDGAFAKRLGNAGQSRIRELYDPTTIGRHYVERLGAIAKAI